MFDAILAPILKLLKRTGHEVRQLVEEIVAIDLAAKRVDTRKVDKKMNDLAASFGLFARDYVQTVEEWNKLRDDVEVLKAKLAEAVIDAPMLAEKVADAETIALQMDLMLGYAPIQLARHILALHPEMLNIAVKEVSTHEGGLEQLDRLMIAIGALRKEYGANHHE